MQFLNFMVIITLLLGSSVIADPIRVTPLKTKPQKIKLCQARPKPQRGLWMHYHSGNSYGMGHIIGNTAAENIAISRLNTWKIKRVYTGLKTLPISNRTDVAAWNNRLHINGIQSQLLLGKPHYIFPGAGCRDVLIERIQTRLIDFHEGTGPGMLGTLTANERFDGLHLDIEPHQFKSSYYGNNTPSCAPTSMYWSAATRAELFALLYDTLAEVRTYLDNNGHADLPIHIDLPYWVDSSSNFDWNTTPDFTDGSDWIYSTSLIVDGMSFMTYGIDDPNSIRSKIAGERSLLLDSIDVRPAVNAKERSAWSNTITWTYVSDLKNVVEDLESGTGLLGYGVDIHNYRYLFNPWPIESVVNNIWVQ